MVRGLSWDLDRQRSTKVARENDSEDFETRTRSFQLTIVQTWLIYNDETGQARRRDSEPPYHVRCSQLDRNENAGWEIDGVGGSSIYGTVVLKKKAGLVGAPYKHGPFRQCEKGIFKPALKVLLPAFFIYLSTLKPGWRRQKGTPRTSSAGPCLNVRLRESRIGTWQGSRNFIGCDIP